MSALIQLRVLILTIESNLYSVYFSQVGISSRSFVVVVVVVVVVFSCSIYLENVLIGREKMAFSLFFKWLPRARSLSKSLSICIIFAIYSQRVWVILFVWCCWLIGVHYLQTVFFPLQWSSDKWFIFFSRLNFTNTIDYIFYFFVCVFCQFCEFFLLLLRQTKSTNRELNALLCFVLLFFLQAG